MQPLQLTFAIHRATHRIAIFIGRNIPGLSQAEAHILCHLIETGDSTVGGLHRAFAHKRSTLTSILDRMEAGGLITRRTSQSDRRSFVVSLTRAGRTQGAKIHRLLESLEKEVLRGAPHAETRNFVRLLERAGEAVTRIRR